jgi:hypothetical protein
MKYKSKLLYRSLFLSVFSLFICVCAATPDPSSPGSCKLTCANSKLPANNARIRLLGGNAITLACQGIAAGQNYPESVPIYFIIEQTSAVLPTTPIPGEKAPDPLVADVGTPVAGVSFEPAVLAGIGGPANPDDTASKYKGIITSQDEWCTDACGVGVFEFVPLCTGAVNTITLQVHSGGASTTTTLTVN